MIIKLLGVLDIISSVVVALFSFFGLFKFLILFIAFYLLVKGIIFALSKDIASIADILCSLVIFLSLNFTIPKIVLGIISLFLLQKGVFSLIS